MSSNVLSTAEKMRMEGRTDKPLKSSIATSQSTKPKDVDNGASSKKENPNTTKRKRPSAFRIKAGCVVALRLQPQGNGMTLVDSSDQSETRVDTTSLVAVWSSPVAGRDEGLALIGRRVRCFLPKSLVGEQKRRVVEGEIVRLLDLESTKPLAQGKPLKIELLMDRKLLEYFPFLPRTDEDIDESQLSSTAKRNHRLEAAIRGQHKVTVRLKLAPIAAMAATADKPTNSIMWAIQKLVPSRLFHVATTTKRSKSPLSPDQQLSTPDGTPVSGTLNGEVNNGDKVDASAKLSGDKSKKRPFPNGDGDKGPQKKRRKVVPVTRHMGDGHDPPEQQIGNWRWFSSRYHDMMLSWNHQSIESHSTEILSGGFVGEVLKVEASAAGAGTLAMVTLRRLVLPEQSATGRLPHHGRFDVFDDHDNSLDNRNITDDGLGPQTLIKVPIEQLVVVARKLTRVKSWATDGATDEPNLDRLILSRSYSFRHDLYESLTRSKHAATSAESRYCHRCRRGPDSETPFLRCESRECPLVGPGSQRAIFWCRSCSKALDALADSEGDETYLPCCRGVCDCRRCLNAGPELLDDLREAVADLASNLNGSTPTESTAFAISTTIAASLGRLEFGLPEDYFDPAALPKPLAQPSTRQRTVKQPKRVGRPPGASSKTPQASKVGRPSKSTSEKKRNGSKPAIKGVVQVEKHLAREDYTVFKPTCARHLAYDDMRKHVQVESDPFLASTDRPRNLRLALLEKSGETEKDDKSSSRAARANQRRLMKDVAAIGASIGVDTLANREALLRFDRSGIHAWGVFADEDLAADEMIIEYRGELIENAMAEKRENLYAAAKIGSDYMFRIDALQVCDATKQGNVARFINASCDPNCYTKIITLDGVRRIVIYAKRDIRAGEELCYDYKFPLEYDPAKRIPCHCGASNCRGYMNWDKRYIALPPSEHSSSADEGVDVEARPLKSMPDDATIETDVTATANGKVDQSLTAEIKPSNMEAALEQTLAVNAQDRVAKDSHEASNQSSGAVTPNSS